MRTLVLVVAAVLALGYIEASGEPIRPRNLPAKAFWVGGPDGGVFVLLMRQDDSVFTSYAGAIYNPDGSVWYKGQFTLQPPSGGLIDPTNRQQFAGWDGKRLLLQDGRALVAKHRKERRVSEPPASLQR